MTKTEQQTRILNAIKDRGWITNELYLEAAQELAERGQIKLSTKRTAVGATRFIWIAA